MGEIFKNGSGNTVVSKYNPVELATFELPSGNNSPVNTALESNVSSR